MAEAAQIVARCPQREVRIVNLCWPAHPAGFADPRGVVRPGRRPVGSRVCSACNDDNAALILWEIRLPRSLGAWCAGALLGMAGALAQALSQTPGGPLPVSAARPVRASPWRSRSPHRHQPAGCQQWSASSAHRHVLCGRCSAWLFTLDARARRRADPAPAARGRDRWRGAQRRHRPRHPAARPTSCAACRPSCSATRPCSAGRAWP